MTRLLLHIGHPKTGTTALQSVLSANAATLLQEASVLYPTKTTPSEYKHAFAIPWLLNADNESIRRRARSGGDQLKATSQDYWTSILAEIKETSPEQLILSAEGFWSILRRAPAEQITFFRNKLYDIADHVQVVAYLKSPASYFLSKINQKLRNYRPVSLPRSNYLSLAMQGWEGIAFDDYAWRIFDRKLLRNQDIVDDFCSHYLPASLSSSALSRDGVEQANESVSNEALVLLEELVEHHPILRDDVYDPRRSRAVALLRQADHQIGGSRRPSLTEKAQAGIISRCRDLAWLQSRGLTFPDIDPALINHPPTVELPESFTCVSDFCPIDAERLGDLRDATTKDLDKLLRPQARRFFWPFGARAGR